MRILEKTLVILILLAVLLLLNSFPGGSILTTFSVLSLSCLYLVFGFALFNGIRARSIFRSASYEGVSAGDIAFAIISGTFISAGCLTILFNIMKWAGGGMFRYAMLVPLLLVCVTGIVLAANKNSVGKNVLWRVVPVLLLDVFFLLKYYFMF